MAVGWAIDTRGIAPERDKGWVLKLDRSGEVPGCTIGVDVAIVTVAADVIATPIDVVETPIPLEGETSDVVVGEPPANVEVDCFHSDPGDIVCICHLSPGAFSHARTLCIGSGAAEAHLAQHGDVRGRCDE